ncbi:hypothetical protein ACFX2K_002409 [Malus domestica]
MVVVDRLSKYNHFIALCHPYTAAIVAQEFVDKVFQLHGMPSIIVNDRDTVFFSSFWKEFFKLQGSRLCMSSSYHPQSDGQTEVVNRCRLIFGVSLVGNLRNGWNGYHGQNRATIHLTTHLQKCVLLRLCMDTPHLTSGPMKLV